MGERGLSRRDLLRYSGLAAAGVVGASALDACGSSAPSGGPRKKGGILTHGATGGSGKDALDPHFPVTNPDIARVSNLFEPLLFWDNDYKLAPALAESVTPSADAITWTIKLRKGVTFHNGKNVTAADVLFSVLRVADPKKPGSAGTFLSTILDRSKSKANNDGTVTLVLKQPYALLDANLAEYTFGIIPANFDINKPVGTGAFAFESFTPGKTSTFKKYAGYWGHPAFADSLVIQDFADDNAKVNALLAGQVQTIDNLPNNLVDAVKKQGGGALVSKTGAWVPFTMRVDQKPFSDVRVRQAMRLIVDRQQIIDQALSGNGFLGNDLYAPFDPAFNKSLPQRQQDIAQAKSLLKSAGQSNLQVELFTGDDIGAVAPAAASLFVQQAKKAGVTVKVNKKNPFYGTDYLSYPFAQDFWNTRNFVQQAQVGSIKGGAYNETHFNDPAFTKLVNDASKEVDQAKRATLIQDAQKIEYDSGGYIIWGFRNQLDGYSSKVQGLKPSKYLPLGSYKFDKISLSA
ncbi:MAG: ABC transporter substrate-binding protein [Marmoricola sp.]